MSPKLIHPADQIAYKVQKFLDKQIKEIHELANPFLPSNEARKLLEEREKEAKTPTKPEEEQPNEQRQVEQKAGGKIQSEDQLREFIAKMTPSERSKLLTRLQQEPVDNEIGKSGEIRVTQVGVYLELAPDTSISDDTLLDILKAKNAERTLMDKRLRRAIEIGEGQKEVTLSWANEEWYKSPSLSLEDRQRYDWLRPHKEKWEAGEITNRELSELFGKSIDTVRGWRRKLNQKRCPDMNWKKRK